MTVGKIEELFRRQTHTWPQLDEGLQGLKRAKTRPTRIDWFEVLIRHIPHRVRSTTAPVDTASVAQRPCFLCHCNMPAEQEALPFDEEFTIYCNPFPIVDYHLTIVHKFHTPQRIAGRLGNMADLATALPGYFVIYNGPECGASAPDHLHFQAGARGGLPIEQDTAALAGATVPNYARNVFLFREKDRSAFVARMGRAIDLLAVSSPKASEPMVNIAVLHEKGEWVAYLFPRSKHRPEVFHTGELTVSPATIDLCGVFVVPLKDDFEKITGDTIAAIFREVTLPDPQFHEVVQKLESQR
jgi:ATP adenylyltransferase/5',5'''-P-1,P-4-tetraphosphate phosphorylase II